MGDFLLIMKKQFRIKDSIEFAEIIRKRKTFGSRNFVIYAKKREKNYARIGISVPTRLGKAHQRNLIKRQVREMLKDFKYYECDYDLIIIVKKMYLSRSFRENEKDLENLLKQVKI